MKFKLIEKRPEAKGTKSFFWEPNKRFEFMPGQFLYYTLPKLGFPDARGATRHFTISASPTETPPYRLTTRIREESGFKKSLDALSIGSVLETEGPDGTFILDASDKGPHIFIAGGIGITPFRSMIKFILDKNLGYKMHLIYSNSHPEEIAFREEFDHYADLVPNFNLTSTVSKKDESKTPWVGLVGRIDASLIQKVASGYENPTFWVAGPPPMVDAMEKALDELRIPSSRVRTEKFTGY